MTQPTAKIDPGPVALSPSPAGQQPQASAPGNRSPVTILMVDDQPGKLLTYEAILKELGENLVKAQTGREALDHLLRGDIAIVLMDVSMPEIDGFELADMMRQHPRFQKTPIIFISAIHMSEMDRMRGYQIGAVDYISVPVIPDVLRAKVSVFAELHRKTRELQELNRELEARVVERSEELRVLNGQLQERVAELESVMQVLPIGVAIAHDADCRVITGNAALSQLSDAEPGENLSKTSRPEIGYDLYEKGKLLSPEDMPLQKAAFSGRSTGLTEIEFRKPGKPILTMLASASPLFGEQGEVRGAVGAFFDMTERKRLEETLRERAELLDLATEAIMVRDSTGVIRFWNAGAEALYGWTRQEAIGANAHDLLSTEFPVPRDEFNASLLRLGRWEGDLPQRTRDGREIVVSSRHALKQNSSLILEINRDITAQLLAEEALRRNDRLAAMGKVAGIVAHEINNPLEAITNTFYLLRHHPSLDDEAQYYAGLAEQELARVSHITKQTLSFYRESQQAMHISLTELLDSVLELQHRLLMMNKITIEKRYATKGMILGFPVELKQVFVNLISNAIQAMPDGGCMRIRVNTVRGRRGRPSGVRVAITDTGSGIPPEAARRLFEPFFTTKSTKGTGLGLWISRGIVQKYDGTLRFRSIFGPHSAATCFEVFLPMLEALEPRAHAGF